MFVKKLIAVLLLAVLLVPAAAIAENTEGEWWDILLLGGDSYDVEDYEGTTDTMIVLSVNRETGEIRLTSIMRDTMVTYGEGESAMICEMNVIGGPELAVQAVNETFGLNIEDYVVVNMASLVDIIDLLGGVDIEITESERTYTNDYIENYLQNIETYEGETYVSETGMVHLNGLQAVAYLRNMYTDSDSGRAVRNQKVLIAAAYQAQNMEVDELMAMSDEFFAHIVTNMTSEELKELAMIGLTVETTEIGQFCLPEDTEFLTQE